ncbi:MAG: LysR family transcriptional regulator [Burkholderiales bacterium]|nr:LysR family transcriptional regulator [Burkholderiales bacterium]
MPAPLSRSHDLNLLRTLDALLDTGSVTAAAERLHLSVPATSHALARLREAVGDPLLVRAGRRLVPTPRALAMKAGVSRVLADAQALLAAPADHDLHKVRRNFVIRAPDGMSVAYGAALASALQQAMPQASLQFVPEAHDDRNALREARIDLDIGSFKQRDPEIEVAELSRQAHIGAVRDDHPLLRGRRSAQRYAEAAHVAVMQRPNRASPVDDALAQRKLQRRVILTVPSSYAALVAAARSTLVATVTERIARAMAPSMGLTLFELPLQVTREPLLMAWHPRHGADAAHRWLRDAVKRAMAARHTQPLALETLRRPVG